MAKETTVYAQRGVSSQKKDVHRAIQKLDKGLFPGAFCKILPDHLGGSQHRCNVIHPDTAGTKAGLAWLMATVTKNLRWLKGVPVDALVMNVDDIGCIGVTDGILVNQTIGRNAFLVDQDMIRVIIEGADEFCKMLATMGIGCHFGGGETASVGDIVRTLDVGSSAVARMRRKNVIDASNMVPEDWIVGFSSTGRAKWEKADNSGIGANGLTNGRHDALCHIYRTWEETYAPQMNPKLVYRGKHLLIEPMPEDPRFSVGEALLSPTRTYLPLIKAVLDEVPRRHIHGIIHCSGGGQTKIAKFGKPGNRYVKDNTFPVPPIFQMLQRVSGCSWHEMYQVYNMGHRLEMVVPSQALACDLIEIASKKCDLQAQIVGRVEKGRAKSKREVVITNIGRGFPTLTY